jgi:hypothetical protein
LFVNKLVKTHPKTGSMANEEKLSAADLAAVAVIVLILLFFPFKMASEHQQDATAMSYYHNGR